MTDLRNTYAPLPASASHADRIAHAYAAWRDSKGQSRDVFLDLMADGIEMRTVLDPVLANALAVERKSLAEARDYFDVLARDWEMIDFPTEKVVADGDTVVWIGSCHWRHRATGNEIQTPKVDVWEFEDGQAVRFLEMFDSLGFARTVGAR